MPPKKQNLVEQLRHAIQHCGETEYAIAKGSGVSQSVVNRFVNGERSIGTETAQNSANIFDSICTAASDGTGVGSNSQIETSVFFSTTLLLPIVTERSNLRWV